MKCGVDRPNVGPYLLFITSSILVAVKGKSNPYCSCIIAPQFMSLTKQMQEHSGIDGAPPRYTDQLSMSSCTCALYRKDPSKPEPSIGSWVLDRVGKWTFTLLPHKYGTVNLYFIVEDPNSDASVGAHIDLKVIQNPDPPIPFLDVNGYNVLSASDGAEIVVEQNGDNGDYKPFTAIIGAFDYDLNDAMTSSVTTPARSGTVTISSPSSAILQRSGLCPTSSPANSSASTSSITTSSSTSSPSSSDSSNIFSSTLSSSARTASTAPSVSGTFPCGFAVPYPSEELVWHSAVISYVPETNHFGNDTFSITIFDRNTEGTVLHFNVLILHNPCQNKATCNGPNDDPDCVLRRRQYEFLTIGYGCSCTRGWIGSTCSVNFDDCLSSPCPPYRVCVDRHNAYECLCPSNLQHCDPLLSSWQTALVVIVTGMCICLITVGLILLARRRNAQFLDAMWRF